MNKSKLTQMQGLPLEIKILKTQQRIREWYEYYQGNVYVSFSGGKDSTVLLHMAREIYPHIQAVFCNTGLEYPEIKEFVRTINNVVWLKPKMNFKDVIDKHGIPFPSKEQSQYIDNVLNTKSEKMKERRIKGNSNGRFKISNKWMFLIDGKYKVSDKCCNEMKKKPFRRYEKETGNHPIIGVMANESIQRLQNYLRNGCNAFNCKRPVSNPMGFWKENDVLQYLYEHKIPYASGIYGDIIEENGIYKTTKADRTGCVFCLYGIVKENREDKPNRLERMRDTHPKLYKYCIENLDFGNFLDYVNENLKDKIKY